MLMVGLHLNDDPIGTVYCVNAGPVSDLPGDTNKHADPDQLYAYSYEYHKPNSQIIRGTVRHYRLNGTVALLKEICEDIETKGGK